MVEKLHIVSHEKYALYDFGVDHPFYPQRAKEFITLMEKMRPFPYQLVPARKAKDKDILRVHTLGYLERVKRLAHIGGVLSGDTPVAPEILEAAYFSVGGSMKAAHLALEGKRVINLLGGLHHAGSDNSSGFCIFNDHGIAIRTLQEEGLIQNAAVLDIDVHAGNGTQEIFYHDPTVFTVSIHQDPLGLYPGTGFATQIGAGKGKGFNLNLPLPAGTGPREYLATLDRAMQRIEEYAPELLCIVLGVDTFKEDPLASMNLTQDTYSVIGKRLQERFSDISIAVFCAGGYSKELIAHLWLRFCKGFMKGETNGDIHIINKGEN